MITEHKYEKSDEAFIDQFRKWLDPKASDIGFRGVLGWKDDQVLVVTDPRPTVDLGWVDFTPMRWHHFLRHYIHMDSFQYFIQRLPVLRKSQQIGYTAPVIAKHNLGNCLMGLTARWRTAQQAELTIISRTTIWAPTGALDLYLGSLIADWWRERCGVKVTLRWHMYQQQMTTWKSLPFLLNMAYRSNPSNFEASEFMVPILSDSPTKNKYLKHMRGTYVQARDWETMLHHTYKMMVKQVQRMLAVEQRFLMGHPRSFFPSVETLLDPNFIPPAWEGPEEWNLEDDDLELPVHLLPYSHIEDQGKLVGTTGQGTPQFV